MSLTVSSGTPAGSSTATSGSPSASASSTNNNSTVACSPDVAPAFEAPNDVAKPFCQFNWPQPIDGLDECCRGDVHVLDNCTQYCYTTLQAKKWRECVLPRAGAGAEDGVFVCNLNTSDTPATAIISELATTAPTQSRETALPTGTGLPSSADRARWITAGIAGWAVAAWWAAQVGLM